MRIALARRAVPEDCERYAFQVTKTYPDETDVQVKFMKKKHNCYIWPTIDDLSIVEDFEIIKTLDPPDLVSRGSYAFNS